MTEKKMSRREAKKAKLKAVLHDKHNQVRGAGPIPAHIARSAARFAMSPQAERHDRAQARAEHAQHGNA